MEVIFNLEVINIRYLNCLILWHKPIFYVSIQKYYREKNIEIELKVICDARRTDSKNTGSHK
jgi:hypothetical protein